LTFVNVARLFKNNAVCPDWQFALAQSAPLVISCVRNSAAIGLPVDIDAGHLLAFMFELA